MCKNLRKFRKANMKKKRKYSNMEYTFVQAADTQLGLMSDLAKNQWIRYIHHFVSFMTFGKLNPKHYLPIPYIIEEHRSLSQDELLDLEIKLCNAAVEAINNLSPQPKFVCYIYITSLISLFFLK